MSEIACTGSGSVLAIGDVVMPEHGLGIAGGYDDSYHLTPARLVRQMVQLGYRGDVVHYVGMSHYMRLEAAERSEEHTYELQSLMRNSYAVFCLKKKKKNYNDKKN